jgi:hypothetical protein
MSEEITNIKIQQGVMSEKINNIEKDVNEIKNSMKEFIHCADKKYALKDSFEFWRNILISGLVVSIFLMLINLTLK